MYFTSRETIRILTTCEKLIIMFTKQNTIINWKLKNLVTFIKTDFISRERYIRKKYIISRETICILAIWEKIVPKFIFLLILKFFLFFFVVVFCKYWLLSYGLILKSIKIMNKNHEKRIKSLKKDNKTL